MATTANYGWEKPANHEDHLETLLQQVLDDIDADLAAAFINTASPVAIAGGGTLDGTAFGKLHVVTGTSVDYTITLPTPTLADVGKLIEFHMDDALTKLITLNAGSGRSINGQQTRIMWAGETVQLRCVGTSGVCWAKRWGATRPMSGLMYLNANQSIANASGPVKVTLNSAGANVGGMVDTVNNRFNIKRPGTYEITGQTWFNSVAVPTGLLDFYKNGAQLDETYGFSPSASNNLVIKGATVQSLAAGDQIDLRVFQNSGSAQNLIGHATAQYTRLALIEQLGW